MQFAFRSKFGPLQNLLQFAVQFAVVVAFLAQLRLQALHGGGGVKTLRSSSCLEVLGLLLLMGETCLQLEHLGLVVLGCGVELGDECFELGVVGLELFDLLQRSVLLGFEGKVGFEQVFRGGLGGAGLQAAALVRRGGGGAVGVGSAEVVDGLVEVVDLVRAHRSCAWVVVVKGGLEVRLRLGASEHQTTLGGKLNPLLLRHRHYSIVKFK